MPGLEEFLGGSVVSEQFLTAVGDAKKTALNKAKEAGNAAGDDDVFQIVHPLTGVESDNPGGFPGAAKSASIASDKAAEALDSANDANASAIQAREAVKAIIEDSPAVVTLRATGDLITKIPSKITRYNPATQFHDSDSVGFGWNIGLNGAEGPSSHFNSLYTKWRITGGRLEEITLYILDLSSNPLTFANWRLAPKLHTQTFKVFSNLRPALIGLDIGRIITENIGSLPIPLGIHLTFRGTGGLSVRPAIVPGVGNFASQTSGNVLDATASGTILVGSIEHFLATIESGGNKASIRKVDWLKADERFGGGAIERSARQALALSSILESRTTLAGSIVETFGKADMLMSVDSMSAVSTRIDTQGKDRLNLISFTIQADATQGTIYEVEVSAYSDIRVLAGQDPADPSSVNYGKCYAREKVPVFIEPGVGPIEIPVPIKLKDLGDTFRYVTVVAAADKACFWGGRNAAGFDTYNRNISHPAVDGFPNLIRHPEPVAGLGLTPISNRQIYFRAEQVVPKYAHFVDGLGLAPGSIQVPEIGANTVRLYMAGLRMANPAITKHGNGQNSYTRRFGVKPVPPNPPPPLYPLTLHIMSLGASIAQSEHYQTVFKELFVEHFPGMDIGPGGWDPHQNVTPAGNVFRVSRTGFLPSYSVNNLATGLNPNINYGPGGWRQRWPIGAEEVWEFPSPGIARFILYHDRLYGGNKIVFYDNSNGDAYLGEADLGWMIDDGVGGGLTMTVITMPLASRRIKMRCEVGMGGPFSQTVTLYNYGDLGIDADGRLLSAGVGRGLLLLSKAGTGSTEVDHWDPFLNDPRGWAVLKATNGLHRMPPYDVTRLAIGIGNRNSSEDERVLAEGRALYASIANAVAINTIDVWKTWEGIPDPYPSDQIWIGPADWSQETLRFGRMRPAAFEGLSRASKAENVSHIDLARWCAKGSADTLGFLQNDRTHPNLTGAYDWAPREFHYVMFPNLFV